MSTLPVELSNIGPNKFDKEFTILLPEPKNKGGRVVGKSFWTRVLYSKGSVEGKIHLPLQSARKLVIFHPGFPGDGSTRLERLWLSILLENDYAVFAIRHNGTIINRKYSSYYLNCPERQQQAKIKMQRLLGENKKYSIADWLVEPYIAFSVFSSKFEEIYLVGHSLGSLASLYSLIKLADDKSVHLSNLKRFISLAGGVGRVRSDNDKILIQWMDYLNRDEVKERIDIGNSQQNIVTLKSTYKLVHKEGKNIPLSIDLIFVSPWGDRPDSLDELCPLIESVEAIASLGRGLLIFDKTQRSNTVAGQLAHDMDNLSADMFLNFVNNNWLPTSQISVIK